MVAGSTWNANAICDSIMLALPNDASFIGSINFQGQRFISGYIYWAGGNAYINAIIGSFGTAHYVWQMGNSNRQLKLITTTVV